MNFISDRIDLHSNMVRFIIDLDSLSFATAKNLHSNMVRFIIIRRLMNEESFF